MSPSAQSPRDSRSSVDKAFSVIRAFERDASTGVGVSELARRAGLSKSTTFRLLATLEENQVVERAGTAYRLGPFALELGASSPTQNKIRDAFTPFLADLYEATHQTVQLAVLEGPYIIYLNKLEGHQRLRSPSRIGGRMPGYCTGVGKVLLAYDSDALEATSAMQRYAWTSTTIVDETELRAHLQTVKRNGFALDRGESLGTLSCIAAPVFGPEGKPIAALSVSYHTDDFNPQTHEAVLRRVCANASRAGERMVLPASR